MVYFPGTSLKTGRAIFRILHLCSKTCLGLSPYLDIVLPKLILVNVCYNKVIEEVKLEHLIKDIKYSKRYSNLCTCIEFQAKLSNTNFLSHENSPGFIGLVFQMIKVFFCYQFTRKKTQVNFYLEGCFAKKCNVAKCLKYLF